MKRAHPALLFTAALGLSVTGCVCPFNPHTPPTPTPIAFPTSAVNALTGTYTGSVTITGTSTYSDGTPTSTTSTAVPTTLVYNSASSLTTWTRVFTAENSTATITNPQTGTTATYNGAVAGIGGVITLSIFQASYSPTTSSLSGTATFSSGSTGYAGNGAFNVAISAVTGGAKYTVVQSWTISAPSGSPVVTVNETGTATLPKP